MSIKELPDLAFDVRCLDYIKINKQVCLHVCQNALRGHGEKERERQTYKQTGRQTDSLIDTALKTKEIESLERAMGGEKRRRQVRIPEQRQVGWRQSGLEGRLAKKQVEKGQEGRQTGRNGIGNLSGGADGLKEGKRERERERRQHTDRGNRDLW